MFHIPGIRLRFIAPQFYRDGSIINFRKSSLPFLHNTHCFKTYLCFWAHKGVGEEPEITCLHSLCCHFLYGLRSSLDNVQQSSPFFIQVPICKCHHSFSENLQDCLGCLGGGFWGEECVNVS